MRLLPTVLGLPLILLFMAGVNQATTINVPGTASTIQSAIDMAGPWDTILVGPGTYIENLDFKGKGLLLTTTDGPSETTLLPAEASASTILITHGEPAGTVVSRFTISGGTSGGQIHIGSGAHPTICENIIAGYIGAENSVAIKTETDTCLIIHNIFYDNGGISCIGIWGGSAAIVNNTFYNNARGFFSISGRGIAFNNIVMNSHGYGIWGAFSRLEYNDVLGNATDYEGGASPGTGSISEDPLFVSQSGHDFTLTPESPCRNAGDPNPLYNNPNGSRSDMGALPAVGGSNAYIKKLVLAHEDLSHVLSHTPVLSWELDVPSGALQDSIELQIGTSLNWDYTKYWRPGKMAYTDTSIVYGGKPLPDGETCYARLRVHCDTLWSRWLTTSFRMNTAPPSPVLFSPDRVEIGWSRPGFSMNGATDAEGDHLTYEYQLHVDSPTGPVVDSLSGFTPQYYYPSFQSSIDVQENKIYWWSVRAFDGYEHSAWAPDHTFWVNAEQEAPGLVQAFFPPTLTGEPVASLQPRFQWSAGVDPDPYDTVTYKFELSLGPTFALAFIMDGIPTNELVLPDSLDFNGHYWWRVSVRDNHGLGSTSLSADFWTWMLGDLNHSHLVDLGDLSAMIYYLTVSSDRLSDPAYGDLNADCRIDLKDLTTLIAYLMGTYVHFQAGCGSPHPVMFTPKPVEKGQMKEGQRSMGGASKEVVQ